MDLHLRGKVAMVGGASSGIGFAIAEALAREGCVLSICARGKDALQDAAMKLGRYTSVQASVLDLEQDSQSWVDATVAQQGRVDILVFNTGGPKPGNLAELTEQDFMTAWQALMMPYVRLVKAAVPHMKGKGRIVALMSKSVKEPIDGLLLSNAVRSAIHAVQKSLSLQYSGITFNTVCPGMTDTRRLTELAGARGDADMVKQDWAKQMPLGRLIRPEEVGALVAFLCGEQAAAITGQAILIDGGGARGY